MLFGRDPYDNNNESLLGWVILYIALIVMFLEFAPYFY